MKSRSLLFAAALVAVAFSSVARASAQAPAATPSPAASPKGEAETTGSKPSPAPTATPTPGPPFANMHWRQIGPAAAGGRVAAVVGSATDPKLYYLGAGGGGVWKSTNGAQTWDPVFEKEGVASIGDIAIDPTDNQTVWVGTGETNPRNDVSYGDGLYKSTDGGDKWTNVGLKETRYISRVIVDPRNHNHVIVGALGDVFADSHDRGVYVTDDGGKTWKQTLFVGPQSGVSDMSMSAQDPSVVYAGIWQFRRQPWTTTSGGPDDGLYKSTDGGATWTKLTGHGLPTGTVGRIAVAVAPSNGNRVYAMFESSEGVLWRSDDGGANWTMVSKDRSIQARAFYFSHVAVDPKNPDVVYAPSFQTMLSKDGGKTFKAIAEQVHSDFHAIWIAPNDPTRIMLGEDGGYVLTLDGGDNWFFSLNVPIAQIYRVGLGNDNPYTVCTGIQDNNYWCGPSNSLDPSGIQNKAWIVTTGGDGTWGMPEPDDANWIWSSSQDGSVSVYNRVTQDGWFAIPYLSTGKETWEVASAKYRFNWESPLAFAPWRKRGDPLIAYYGGNVVFQTSDRGKHWRVISPDLTRNDKSHQIPAGGPITNDVSGAETTDTLLDIEPAAISKGEIWVGTDDGLVQLTRDYGKHWTDVTPPGAPKGRFETVAPSTLVAGTAYAVDDAHYLGDSAPYAWVTHDWGKRWTKIVDAIPANEWVRTVRPDTRDRNLVYLGTEEGIWISFEGGAHWQSFKNDLPSVSVHDIRIQPQYDDLVIATHGRAAYIMDDIRPLQELGRATAAGSWVFTPRAAYEWTLRENDEGTYTNYAADNPPYGVTITFYQKDKQKGNPALDILDANGRVIRSVSGTHKVGGKDIPYITNKVGLNRYTWDFNANGPVQWTGQTNQLFANNEIAGPGVPPGDYSVRMTLSGHTYVQHFAVKPDPRSQFTQADYELSYRSALRQLAHLSTVDTMLNNLDDLKKQIDTATDAAKKANNAGLIAKLQDLATARTALFDTLGTDVQGEGTLQENHLHEDVQGAYNAAQGLNTPAAADFIARVDRDYVAGVDRYDAFVKSAIAPVNDALKAASIKTLTIGEVHS
ncbi:MAG: hypothetical protein JO277_10890 [Candidatus Eremiobacteraeota bacterium]|nr:hypothetical protein [Candidatus Eremiobacteraeota bacterium]